MAKEVDDGQILTCEYCNEEFGLVVFDNRIESKCSVCEDGDEPCPECGIAPSQDMRIKFICKPCQIEHNIIASGTFGN